MISMIRATVKLRIGIALTTAVFTVLHAPPARAAEYFFSANGSGSACTVTAPCQLSQAVANAGSGSEQIACADSTDNPGVTISKSITIDCSGTAGSIDGITVNGSNITVVLKNFTQWSVGYPFALQAGTMILDNVHVFTAGISAIAAEPTAPSTLIVRNSLFDNCAGGVLLKPGSGGSLAAQFDHVAITGAAGGIKIDTTNGPVTLDVTDSAISNNAANGINVVGNAGGQAMVSLKNSVIAKNGAAGLVANGANAGVLVQMTLLDENAAGATSIVDGGRISTYGNNSIVGSAGSGFSQTVGLQ